MTDCVAVWITAANPAEAESIAQCLVNERLAACVQKAGAIESLYWWKGRKESAGEVVVTAKTTGVLLDILVRRVKELHSYEVPEIIALPIIGGNSEYIRWIHDSVTG